MPAPANLIHETSTTTGTGNLTVAAVNGKVRFSDSTYGFGTGGSDVFWYFISNQSAAEWEIGTGHMSDANTLVRDTILFSSNSNNAVNFSAGTKDVTNDIPAANQISTEGGKTLSGTLTLPNTGLHLLDTNASHDLIIAPGSNLTADRTLTIVTGDADQTLTLPLGGWVEIESGSVSNAAQADVDISGYDLVQIWVTMRPNTDSENIYIRMSQNGGSSFLSGAGDYWWSTVYGGEVATSSSDTEIHTQIQDDYSNDASEATELVFTIRRPNASGNYKTILWNGIAWHPSGSRPLVGGGRLLDNTNAVDALRFFASSGNITMDWHSIGMNLS